MNKKIKIVFLITILFLLTTLFLLLKFSNNSKYKCTVSIELEDVFDEINSATLGNFVSLDKDLIGKYYQLDFLNGSYYYVGYNNNNIKEHFVIVDSISTQQKKDLSMYVNNIKSLYPTEYLNVKIKEYNQYTYVIFTEEFYSHIDGIIRSFINCN